MGSRRGARRVAVQALYSLDLNPDASPEEAVNRVLEEHSDAAVDREYVHALVAEAWGSRAELDSHLESASRHWKLSRMDRVDRGVLRLGAAELLYRADTPVQVIINEGVELAKEFGTPDSPAFVNGILDRIAHDHRPGEL